MRILDCTLRDGGYYTQWDFPREVARQYMRSMDALPIDYVEVGYRSFLKGGYLGRYFYSPRYVLEEAKALMPRKKLAVLLDVKDVPAERVEALLEPARGIIDLVRLAVAPEKLGDALAIAERARALGFEVALNVMYMSRWVDDEAFLDRLKDVEGAVDYFYMVDSFGGSMPEDVAALTDAIRARCTLPLAFHGHNNLEMALANTREAMRLGFEMVDATITGMGRGAGNLRTELLLTHLAARGEIEVDFSALTSVVETFEALRAHHGWGTNIPYMISGANSLPQKDVMGWMKMKRYSVNAIVHMLQQIHSPAPPRDLPALKPSGERALLIGGGPSVDEFADDLRRLVDDDTVLIHTGSRYLPRFADLPNRQLVCFRGVEAERFLRVVEPGRADRYEIVVSSEPEAREAALPDALIPQARALSRVAFADRNADAPVAQGLQCAVDLGVRSLYLAGFDGYAGGEPGTFDLKAETQALLDRAEKIGFEEMLMVTPSTYAGVPQGSVFGILSARGGR